MKSPVTSLTSMPPPPPIQHPPVQVIRDPHRKRLVGSGDRTRFFLVWHYTLDEPSDLSQRQWRSFEKRFFRTCCRVLDSSRSEKDVFLRRAQVGYDPGLRVFFYKDWLRYTLVYVNERELAWLEEFGRPEVRLLDLFF
jgi:hypothetical protein